MIYFYKTCRLFNELRTIKGRATGTELKTYIVHRVVDFKNKLLFFIRKFDELTLSIL